MKQKSTQVSYCGERDGPRPDEKWLKVCFPQLITFVLLIHMEGGFSVMTHQCKIPRDYSRCFKTFILVIMNTFECVFFTIHLIAMFYL